MLLCTCLGGLHPAILIFDEADFPRACSSYKWATDETWNRYVEDLKTEATTNEKARIRAMNGKVYSNQQLPAEYVQSKQKV